MRDSLPLQWMLHLPLLLFILLLAQPSQQLTNCGFCLCDPPTITCDFYKSKTKILDNIDLTNFVPSSNLLRSQRLHPSSYTDLYINCLNARVLKSQRLTRELLRDFVNLTRVSIVKCDLVGVDSNALDGLTQLKELDVSDNQLERLPSGFLAGKSLTVVRLSENRRLSLESDSFSDVSLERLVLSKCDMAEFPLASLEKIRGLQELTLSQNRIKFVPPSAASLVARLKVFYLDDNPLSCTCPNRWLREIPWERVSPPSLNKSPKGQLPRCKTPRFLQDADLSALAAGDFPCAPPQLLSIDLQLGWDTGRMACVARSDHPGPLVWTYRQLPASALPGDFPEGFPGGRTYQGTGDTFVQSFGRGSSPSTSSRQPPQRHQVSVSTEDDRQTNFTLTLQWPPKRPSALLPTLLDTRGGHPTQELGMPPPLLQPHPQPLPTPAQGDYFSRKQFTLVEMILAVMGTFICTALMFLLVCQITRWYSRREKKRWAGYVTHPYGYSYSGVSQHQQQMHQQQQTQLCGPPSQEYDVPRLDLHLQQQQQPCLPKLPGTLGGGSGGGGGCAAELEFLDYTGMGGSGGHHRMMYNRV